MKNHTKASGAAAVLNSRFSILHSSFFIVHSSLLFLSIQQFPNHSRNLGCWRAGLLTPSQVFYFPGIGGELVRPGDEGEPEAAALGVLQLLADFLGFGVDFDADAS